MFVARFVTNKLQPLRVDALMALKIAKDEGLRAYAKGTTRCSIEYLIATKRWQSYPSRTA